MTRDAAQAKAFYTELFGWSAETMPVGGIEYTMLSSGENQRGGLMQMPDDMPSGVPSNWLVHFAVESADDFAKKVVELGGIVQMGPQDIPNIGRFAVVSDTQGAVFSGFQPLQQEA